MGLDAVELVMEVEEQFGIEIDDREAEKTLTVGELYEVVLGKCGKMTSNSCVKQRAFYALRNGLVKAFNADRKEIRTETHTSKFFPALVIRHRWEGFGKSTGLRLPALELSSLGQVVKVASWILLIIPFTVFMTGITLSTTLGMSDSTFELGFIILVIFIFVVGFLLHVELRAMLLRSRLATRIPSECQTLRGLTQALATKNSECFKPCVAETDVWTRLKGIISEQLGVDEDSIRAEMRFVEDLGI